MLYVFFWVIMGNYPEENIQQVIIIFLEKKGATGQLGRRV
jgi:hypothetical protein